MSKNYDPSDPSFEFDSSSSNTNVDNNVSNDDVSGNTQNNELTHNNCFREGDPGFGLPPGFDALSDSQKSPVVETEHIEKLDSTSSNSAVDRAVSENNAFEHSENSVNNSDYANNKELHHIGGREGDPGFGLPPGFDQSVDPLPPYFDESPKIEDPVVDFDSTLKDLSEQRKFSFPYLGKFLKYASWIIYLIVAVLFLFSISQFAYFYSSVKSLPIWLQWICFIVVIACLSFIILTCFIIIKKIWSFPQKKYLDIRALEILSQRQELRSLVNQKFEEGKIQLEKYLNSFDLEKPDNDFKALFSEEEFKKLIQGKKSLLSENNWDKPQEWIHDFQGFAFQGILDSVAKRIVKRYAFAVASGTAISPKSFVDQTIVVMGSIAMTKDLLTLYRIQPAIGESIYLLAQGLFIAYIGGKMQWATGSAMEIITESQVFSTLFK